MPVLCLSNLIPEEEICMAGECGLTPPSQLTPQDMPEKNTFIHFELHRERPPTPTSSAPGILLRRFFKTEVESVATIQIEEACMDAEEICTDAFTSTPTSSTSSVLLSHLFKTEAGSDAAMQTEESSMDNEASHMNESTSLRRAPLRVIGDSASGDRNGSQPEVPHKHTFVHFDLHRERPPTPTASAPGVLLSRLFQTKGYVDSSSKQMGEIPMERLPSAETVSSSIADRSTSEGEFDDDSQASTSALDSNKGSPIEEESWRSDELSFNLGRGSTLEELHRSRQCTPCNYFWYKADGCRNASKCEFCHLCPKGEIKKRKKDKLRQMRKVFGVRS